MLISYEFVLITKKIRRIHSPDFLHPDNNVDYPLNTPMFAYLFIRAVTNSFGDNFFKSS